MEKRQEEEKYQAEYMRDEFALQREKEKRQEKNIASRNQELQYFIENYGVSQEFLLNCESAISAKLYERIEEKGIVPMNDDVDYGEYNNGLSFVVNVEGKEFWIQLLYDLDVLGENPDLPENERFHFIITHMENENDINTGEVHTRLGRRIFVPVSDKFGEEVAELQKNGKLLCTDMEISRYLSEEKSREAKISGQEIGMATYDTSTALCKEEEDKLGNLSKKLEKGKDTDDKERRN